MVNSPLGVGCARARGWGSSWALALVMISALVGSACTSKDGAPPTVTSGADVAKFQKISSLKVPVQKVFYERHQYGDGFLGPSDYVFYALFELRPEEVSKFVEGRTEKREPAVVKALPWLVEALKGEAEPLPPKTKHSGPRLRFDAVRYDAEGLGPYRNRTLLRIGDSARFLLIASTM